MHVVRVLVLAVVTTVLLLYSLASQRSIIETNAHDLKSSFVSLYFDPATIAGTLVQTGVNYTTKAREHRAEIAPYTCKAVSTLRTCRAWYSKRDVEQKHHRRLAVQCINNCHGRGVCDKSTGVCACEAGYNGSSCEGVNVRKCNDRTDGMWVASHCAGECDVKRKPYEYVVRSFVRRSTLSLVTVVLATL